MSGPYGEIFFYDFETTGKDAKKDRPVQIGLLRGLEKRKVLLNLIVDPKMAIHPEATKVHGIYQEDVIGAPSYETGLYRLHNFLYDAILSCEGPEYVLPIVSGFNITQYDTPMADACFPEKKLSLFPQLDVLDVLYRYAPFLPKRTLSAAYKHFTGEELTGAHGAIEDCEGTAIVLEHMCGLQAKSPDSFVDELKVPCVYDIMPIGKHSGKHIEDVPKGWAYWMKKNAKDMRPDLKATINCIMSL
jgi:DNA polymerase-3 subunit epsilon